MKSTLALRIALFAVVYGLLAYLCIGLRDPDTQSTLLWPAGGILLGTLMVSDKREWPAWIGVAGILHLLAGIATGRPLPISLVYTLNDLIIMSAVAAVWQNRVRGHHNLESPFNLAWFLGLLLAGGVAGALLSSAGLQVAGAGSHAHWYAWFIADVIGGLVGAPLVIAWSTFRAKRSGGSSFANFYFGLLWFVLLIAAAMLAFDGPTSAAILGTASYELAYLPLLFVILVALVWDQRGMTLALLTLAMITAVNTAQDEGPFAASNAFFGNALLEVQGYIGAACLAGLIMTAIIASRNRALRQAATWKLRFEAALIGSQHLVYEFDPASRQILWGGETLQLLGVPVSALDNIDAFAKLIHPDDRQQFLQGLELRSHPRPDRATADMAYRLRDGAGGWYHVTDTGAPLTDLDETVYRINGLLRLQRTSTDNGHTD